MIVGYVLLVLLSIVLVAIFLPMGIRLRYQKEGLTLKLVIGPLYLTLVPRKKKRKKKPKKKPKEKKKSTKPKEQRLGTDAQKPKGGKLSDLMDYLPWIFELIGHFRRRLLMRKLTLLVNLAGDDPCDLALLYGKANGALGVVIPLLEKSFRIRKRDIQVYCDFLAEKTEIYLDLDIVACPARLLVLSLRYGYKFLKIIWKLNSEKAV